MIRPLNLNTHREAVKAEPPMQAREKALRATRAEINLEAIQYNLNQVRRKLGVGVRILAVVKANAYGHGIAKTSQALVDAGTDYLGVANVDEGILLREKGIVNPILVFTPPFPHEAKLILEFDLTATVFTIDLARQLDSLSSVRTKPALVHVKIDTGMGRLGIDYRESVEFVRSVSAFRYLKIEGLYTHFATAEQSDKSYAKLQLHRFHDVISSLQNSGVSVPLVHCANSAAILDLRESYYNMVRPGIMLYGYYPSHETSESVPLRTALSLRSRIGFVKHVDAGTSISYGRRYITTSKTTIASVPIGYADGLSRHLTNKGEAIVKGKRVPIVGTICMDHVMLDVGSVDVKPGDDVTFIGTDGGETISAWEIADKLETIPYEVCCGISTRVPRIYL